MPGYKEARTYPFTPDLRSARRLAGRGNRIAVMYTCNDAQCLQIARVVKADLKAIGISVRIKAISGNEYFQRVFAKDAPYDVAIMGWIADGLDPSDFLDLLQGNLLPRLDDPLYRHKLAAAERLSGPRRYLAFEALDSELIRKAAPWVAYGKAADHDFFSSRIGCQIYQPIEGIDLAALCIRKP
jgi:ABC-type oligopeptide transport system substrate-binding subunit